MIIEPKVKGFICITAHPAGCRSGVEAQIEYCRRLGLLKTPQKALIIGASAGFGLASRVALAFGGGADTLGVAFERNAEKSRTGSAGWYNTAAFHEFASKDGLYAKTVMGDAFSHVAKSTVADMIKADFGKVDCVIYSLAAPVRTDADTGERYASVIKPVGDVYRSKSIDISCGAIIEAEAEPATDAECAGTVKVMGGEDFSAWMDALSGANLLEPGCVALAYSYIGPEMTHPIYRDGTIGLAKQHLRAAADDISRRMAPTCNAYISINKALVTQASSAIPVVPLYISILYRVMKERGLHEGCIEQMRRMFQKIDSGRFTDCDGYIRMDDYELSLEVQAEVARRWDIIDDENLSELADLDGYRADFLKIFGFGHEDVDYSADTDPFVNIDGAVIL